jgi:dTDP-4-amino-4,6-dideoxygalactose transaminase
VVPGYNYRMDAIQGAVLNVKMNYIEGWTEARRSVASYYDHLLKKRRCRRPAPPPHSRHVYHVYAVALAHRDEAQKALQARGIGVGIHYPVPVHLQKAYASLGYRTGNFPVTELLANQFLSLPIYAELRREQVSEVVMELEKVLLAEAV